MGLLKGQIEYRKFKSGKSLTRKEAVLAQCYVCNGQEDSNARLQGLLMSTISVSSVS